VQNNNVAAEGNVSTEDNNFRVLFGQCARELRCCERTSLAEPTAKMLWTETDLVVVDDSRQNEWK